MIAPIQAIFTLSELARAAKQSRAKIHALIDSGQLEATNARANNPAAVPSWRISILAWHKYEERETRKRLERPRPKPAASRRHPE